MSKTLTHRTQDVPGDRVLFTIKAEQASEEDIEFLENGIELLIEQAEIARGFNDE